MQTTPVGGPDVPPSLQPQEHQQPPRSPHTPGRFKGAIRLTLRLYGADFGILVLTAAIYAAVVAAVLFALNTATSGQVATSGHVGVSVMTALGSGRHVSLDVPGLLAQLLTVVGSAWASVTMAHLLLRHVRTGRPATPADIVAGLPFWGWAIAAALLVELVDLVIAIITSAISPGHAAELRLVGALVSLLVATAVLVYPQMIVDRRSTGPEALLESYRLVRKAGYWDVFGAYFVAGLCLLPVMLVVAILAAIVGVGVGGWLVGPAMTVVVAPLSATFGTVMYLLMQGERAGLDALLPPPTGAAPQHPGPPAV